MAVAGRDSRLVWGCQDIGFSQDERGLVGVG